MTQILQAAIYSLPKVTQAIPTRNKARIHFIMRDQTETDPAKIQLLISGLIRDLGEAAQAADE